MSNYVCSRCNCIIQILDVWYNISKDVKCYTAMVHII